MGLNKIHLIFVLVLLLLVSVSYARVDLVNSEDWVDVYSVMLSSALNDRTSMFVQSQTFSTLTKTVPVGQDYYVYEGNSPLIPNLDTQMQSGGFSVIGNDDDGDFTLSLDPQTGKYLVISRDNYRTVVSLSALAIRENYWVLIADEDNIDQVAQRLESAQEVVGVGNFRRDLLEQLEPQFDTWINNNDIFLDTHDIASRFDSFHTVILADGSALEAEFFSANNPVLLSGRNKIIDNTYDYLVDNNVKSVVIVGNSLSVVGETIRTRSEKQISVFVKFGQSDASGLGQIYALSFYPLPIPNVGITITDAIFNPKNEELIVFYENTGNVGAYTLSTFRVKNGDNEIASGSDETSNFLGEGEVLPVVYNIPLDTAELSDGTEVEFFTSYGIAPSELDRFLTMEGQFGPPFKIGLKVQEFEADESDLNIRSVNYLVGNNRVAVTVSNNGTIPIYYSVKVQDLIVNGLEQDLFKEESRAIQPGDEKISYLTASLDEIDLLDNVQWNVVVKYGSDKDLLFKTDKWTEEFSFEKTLGIILYIIIGAGILVVVAFVMMFIMFKNKSQPVRARKTTKRKR